MIYPEKSLFKTDHKENTYGKNVIGRNFQIVVIEIKGNPFLFFKAIKKYELDCDKELTKATATIFDESTEKYSDSSIYRNKKGFYFKKQGKRYQIPEEILKGSL